MTEDQSRSDFEAWMVDEGYGPKPRICSAGSPCGGEYANQYWHRSWVAWQASRRTYRASVLEEAAKVCDKHAESRCDNHESVAIINCADDIRALAAKTQEGQEP